MNIYRNEETRKVIRFTDMAQRITIRKCLCQRGTLLVDQVTDATEEFSNGDRVPEDHPDSEPTSW